MPLIFAKYEGLGNDFIIVDGRTADLTAAERQAAAMCDRHRGIGGDGVLLVDHNGARPTMHVINADGSKPQMCGNGLRCVALHLQRTMDLPEHFSVDTDAGAHQCTVMDASRITVDMVAGSLDPKALPVNASAPLIDAHFDVAWGPIHVTGVSIGNPHAVIFDDVGDARQTIGPQVGADARFPEGVNVGFARKTGEQAFALDVLERGVGWTRACGTGACAAAVAAVATGRATRADPIDIALPGGHLLITIGEPDQRIRMTGPARPVFDGQYLGEED